MHTLDNNKLSELVDMLRLWIPRKTKTANMSKDFWMPDQSCRVCYECDSQFTIFNRRHHCRLCGRVFCSRCTENSVPSPSEVGEKIRVCNYCFKQWENGITTVDNAISVSSPVLSPSPSATSLVSTQSSCTCNSSISSIGSNMYSTGTYKHVPYSSCESPRHRAQMDLVIGKKDLLSCREDSDSVDNGVIFPNQFGYCMIRSDDEDDEYSVYKSHSETRQDETYSGVANYNEIDHIYGPHHKLHHDSENITTNSMASTMLPDNFDIQDLEGKGKLGEESNSRNNTDESEAPPLHELDGTHVEPMDFENNGQLWVPPGPEDEEDDTEGNLFDDDDSIGEWGYLRSSSSFGSGEYSNRDRSIEVHRKAMKNVVDGHFRALIFQLLQAENLSVGEVDDKESWLEIITSLSWEAATHLKPDTSKGGGMDPGGYVKIKCIACGRRSESMVVKGVVCKKNVSHRRMTSKIYKPRFLILGGALEYQRVANHFSSFDTLLQQEMDHLKMAVAKIDSHHPNVLLVEKSVSGIAQDYLLAKNISLVLNIKRPLLERIARCTGAQIIPSTDHLTPQKLGYCDSFHVEKFLEEYDSVGQGGKKLTKTLMFFEDCPKPLGCTILLKGASSSELKKVKHIVQYGIFAAYHLALETSFLADEGASLPELPLKSPITVALPNKPSSTDSSISTIPGYTVPSPQKLHGPHTSSESYRSNSSLLSDTHQNGLSSNHASHENIMVRPQEFSEAKRSTMKVGDVVGYDNLSEALGQGVDCFHADNSSLPAYYPGSSELPSLEQDNNFRNEMRSLKEEFPVSPSNHQSILVSLSTRCVWKGTVCERSHLFRIKYYGSFDKPLGRFLQDHLFDQSYRCRSCEMPSEAHVHCYTHQQGSLTISVKRLPELILPGVREGKIWMWHRCLRCPRIDGFPPATKRVVMSDAAWGLSLGKFLELSFSNHAAASRVANCGHSLHRDCLRFYGFGRMVACFRYASIDVHSVHVPPSKLEFNYANQEWISKEADEVRSRADILFAEVYNALHQISEKIPVECAVKVPESRRQITVIEGILQKEKEEFEESLHQVLNKDVNVGKPAIDILEINRLRRQLIFHSYVWDQRLIHLASLNNKNQINATSNISFNQIGKTGHIEQDLNNSLYSKKTELFLSSSTKITDQSVTLEPVRTVKRVLSVGRFPIMDNLSDTFDAAWTGENHPISVTLDSPTVTEPVKRDKGLETYKDENSMRWVGPLLKFYHSFNRNLSSNVQNLRTFCEYNPIYAVSFRELIRRGGARMLLPIGINDTVVPVYDDEPTSIIAYALVSPDYHIQISGVESPLPSPTLDSVNLYSPNSTIEKSSESLRDLGSTDESILYTKALHPRVSFTDEGPLGRVKYTVTCYYAKKFEALRRACCPSEIDFVRSLSRCKKWGAQGGKSNVFFAKTLDDRFIIKQVTKTELESFIQFAPEYFKYLSESISTGSPTCLAKILGIYQLTSKHLKGGKELRMDVLVMENLMFRRNVTRLYDLKGSSRSRYNPDCNGNNKVLLDQNLIEAMPTSPIFVGNKAKRLLERAVWNDTAFLASIDVMDYSLLVGVDEKKHELVLGIIDFMRQYTWDKHLETWVKASGILGGPKNTSPTVISPKQYKKRFRKAMSAYFLMVPDQWSPLTITTNGSQSDLCEENSQCETSLGSIS